MTYIEKVKKLFDGELPKSFFLHMKYCLYEKSDKEIAAQHFFEVLMTDKDEKKKAKKLGLLD